MLARSPAGAGYRESRRCRGWPWSIMPGGRLLAACGCPPWAGPPGRVLLYGVRVAASGSRGRPLTGLPHRQ
jgi:hypothetical protein